MSSFWYSCAVVRPHFHLTKRSFSFIRIAKAFPEPPAEPGVFYTQQNGSPANRTAVVFVFKGIRCFHHLIRYPTSTSDPPFLISPCIKHGQNPRRSAAGLSFRQPPGPFREPFRLTKGVRFFCLSAETSIGVIHLSESIALTVSRPLYGRRSFHEAQRHMGLTFSFPIFPPDDFRLLSGAHPRVMLLSCGTAVKPPGSCLFFPFCGRQKHTHF